MCDNAEHQPTRRWLRFSLRSLLVATAVVAVFCAVFVKPYFDRRVAVAKIDSLHGGYGIHLEGPAWLRDRVSENKWFYNLARVSIGPLLEGYDRAHPFDDEALRDLIPYLNDFSRFTTLDIRDTPITDTGARCLLDLENLETLDVSGTEISDVGLADLATLETLHSIDVRETNVTAEGVNEFSSSRPDCEIRWNEH